MSNHQSMSPLNRLAQESSPYLLQHARNPVDWYPWGAEAWERARRENKPVLVSIGYSACHWCHVMEKESFEDPEIARRQNELVVSIKVDREERPDVDEVYMEIVQLIHGHGGWPLNVFCLPDGRPFFGGTYFPPTRRTGMNSWLQVLEAVSIAYQDPANKVEKQADRLLAYINETTSSVTANVPSVQEALVSAVVTLKKMFDSQHAGFGQAPKFPQPFFLSLLLQRDNKVPRDAEAEEMALKTLRTMAAGGVYDQLMGGFHRYAVDAGWLVPHFEKMLYDNALLVPIYVDAWKLTNDPVYRQVAEETLDYLLSEMRTSDGLFFSSTDADSEGEEGKFFTWTSEEIREVLSDGGMADDEVVAFMQHYGVTQTGNFEGRNILNIVEPLPNYRRELIQEEVNPEGFLERGRGLLRERRSERVHPSTDTKIIAAWNGLTIDALARSGMALDSPVYIAAAEQCATVLLDALLIDNRGLRRIYADGRASILAFLDDYACLADGLLSLYLATGDEKWFLSSELLIKEMIAKFWDDSEGGFFTTGIENEALVAKMKPTTDGATPSGNSQAARALARLYALTGESALADRLDAIAAMNGGIMLRQAIHAPLFVHTMVWLRSHRVVAIVGHPDDPGTNALASVKVSGLVEQTLIIQAAPNSNSAIPQLRDKDAVNGQATAYVCQGNTCSAPFQDPAELEEFLEMGNR